MVAARMEDRTFIETVVRLVLSTCREAGGWPVADTGTFHTLNRGGRAGVAAITAEGRNCCIKVFYDTRRFVKWRNRLGFSKACRAFNHGMELARRGVDCPAMLGYAVDPASGWAFLVTDLAKHDRLDYWIEQNGPSVEVAEALGRFIRRMHEAGVTHKDLSLRNLLIRKTVDEFRFLLLDYEDTRFSSEVSEKQRLNDLHHLHERSIATVSEAVRNDFLAAYLNDENCIVRWCEELKKLMAENPSKYTRAGGLEGKPDV